MLKEAIQQIQQLADAAAAAKIVRIPGDDRKAYVQHAGEKLMLVELPPPARSHIVYTLEGLMQFAGAWTSKVKNETDLVVAVWHSVESVVLILDDADRRDKVTMPLIQSEEMEAICGLVQGSTIDQRQLLRFLRVKLKGCLAQCDLPLKLATLNFTSTKTANASLQHGKESLSRRVEAEIMQIDQIPTEIVVEVPVYRTAGETTPYRLVLSLEILVHEEKFVLAPFPGEIDKVVVAAQDSIHDRLTKALPGVSIYFGTP